MELRDLQAQTKLYERQRPSDMVELVRLEGRQYQYLYSSAGQLCPTPSLEYCCHITPSEKLQTPSPHWDLTTAAQKHASQAKTVN